MDEQTPKKQRKEGAASLSPVGSTPSPAGAQAQATGLGPSQVPQWAVGPPNEAAGDNVRTVGRSGATVTDAAKAFRELRVRAPRASSPRRDGGHGGTAQRPPSPKKRKASFNIDKEFILKDDKVKRNTDTQGDISQARGQLGQLLFEFSQIELNRDLLEAIKRTESKTGRSSGRPPAPRSRLDRSAFEVAVTDAAELLQAQLGSVEAHSEDAALRGAILRTYAVQAIAAFADEDSDSEESEAGGEGAAGSSSDDENADSNSRRRMQGASSSQDDQAAGLRGQHQQEAGSHSQDTLPRAASAAGCHSPPHLPPHLQQQQPGRPPGAAFASPPRLQPAGSGAGPAGSSSYLPDAPPDSALEDTATAGGPRRHQDPGREGGAAPPPGPAGNRFAWPSLQQQEQQQQSERGGDDGALQRMRMLSLEAEGSAQQGQSAGDADEDGPQDMIRSPAPVTSRPMAPRLPRLPMGDSQSLLEIRGSQQQEQAPQGRAGHGSGGGTRRTAAAAAGARLAAVFEEAAKLALTGRPEQQQQQQQQGQQAQEQEQESSEGHSTGQASSAAHEAPKRQRRSGDLLPPLFEHSSRQQQQQQQQQPHQRTASGCAAATDQAAAADREISSRAAAAARRAAILGSLRPRERAEHPGPQQQGAQDLLPAGPQEEGADVGGSGTGAGRAAHPDRQQQPPPLQQQQDGQQHEDEAEGGPPGEPSDAALRGPHAAHSGSSVWGSTLVCADLTVNDVASQYWPFLRSAMRGQTATLQAGDRALVASLVAMLGETISDTYVAVSGSGRRPPAEVKSLVAATAFDDFFRAQNGGADSSGASLG